MDRPICTKCHKRSVEKKYVPGRTRLAWRNTCYVCRRPKLQKSAKQRRVRDGIYKIAEGNKADLRCSRCGFIPEHPCQIDVDHKNGDHKDNRPENRQILCANCHRLKTFMSKDWVKGIKVA